MRNSDNSFETIAESERATIVADGPRALKIHKRSIGLAPDEMYHFEDSANVGYGILDLYFDQLAIPQRADIAQNPLNRERETVITQLPHLKLGKLGIFGSNVERQDVDTQEMELRILSGQTGIWFDLNRLAKVGLRMAKNIGMVPNPDNIFIGSLTAFPGRGAQVLVSGTPITAKEDPEKFSTTLEQFQKIRGG